MVPTKKNNPPLTRETILGAATRLFQQRGFNGLGMRQIAEHLQIKAPSLYHHFASKEDLTRHALRQYREEQATRLLAIEDGADLAEQLRMYAGLFAEMLHDGNRLCMYVTMLREPSFQEQACVDELQLFAKQNIDWLEKILHARKGASRLPADVRERELAEIIFASFEGFMTVSLADKTPAAAFRKKAANLLKIVVNSTR
ncbi:TetR/AcrR family transcriptional regulator [Duganella sp. BJB488]|uniref:TetR/AcrR family transcriptional regulator n=1 Tax=unclassified Duganella TaxID=2636909 RepID=UPI000E340664|nr:MULTISPECIES: TetR/AcrR family transcriptional regulator [unclassified Duganella]RFP21746.1 TetR/AcrR family transcriptional regulator [Duganella sp. BJB489]RFP23538.1 TetR/AcrR family transcriptional regulator [Duganella sp. BJB488]RFP38705.1 TetR/AcrR family transcriptional regulator [Duganella sp. BJB480]